MNGQILAGLIGLAMMILAIFGANWLNQQAMKNYIDAKFSGLEGKLEAEFKAVRAEIETVRSEVANLGSRIDRIERQFDTLFKFPKAS